MSHDYTQSNLYAEALDVRGRDSLEADRKHLASELSSFRSKASMVAAEIPRHVPFLTDHSVKHLDALWRLAGEIAGPDFRLSPTEAFVFGGAILLHDLGNAVVAYPRGVESLKGPEWDDLVFAMIFETEGREAVADEIESPPADILQEVLLHRLRQVHAEACRDLATRGFYEEGSDDPVFLIADGDLRNDLGPLIGKIAASHHWDIERVVREFSRPLGTPPGLPAQWLVDPLSLACLLRVADAAHMDSGRTPKLTQRLRDPKGLSLLHWTFQRHLLSPRAHHNQLVYSSKSPFDAEERDAWWLAYESLKFVDQELRSVDALMQRERNDRRFTLRSVAGAESPAIMKGYLQVEGWEPVDVRLKVSDVLTVIDRFGGQRLYGDNPRASLREVISNSADAIRARRVIEGRSEDWGTISVHLGEEKGAYYLEVQDDGVGMSEAVLRGPLLDFGTSFWRSGLARSEHPGLLSRGFRPTGQFGIGFFSIFMLGPRVRVTTQKVGKGHDATRVLELEKDEVGRPFIRLPRPGDPAERLNDAGTRVRVWLGRDPFSDSGLLGEPGAVEIGESKDENFWLSSRSCSFRGIFTAAASGHGERDQSSRDRWWR